MYAMVCTRPDISNAIGVVSKYMANLGKEHWNAMKYVLRYLRGISDYYITFNSNSDSLCDFVDSYFAGDLDKRRSTSCYVFTLAIGSLSFMSKIQDIFPLSTTEVEYSAPSHACKEEIFPRGLLREIGRLHNSVPIFCDNQSAIHLATNPIYHSKTKHIDVKYHFVRQAICEGGVDLKKVHTQEIVQICLQNKCY